MSVVTAAVSGQGFHFRPAGPGGKGPRLGAGVALTMSLASPSLDQVQQIIRMDKSSLLAPIHA